jgi:hypothetical protein
MDVLLTLFDLWHIRGAKGCCAGTLGCLAAVAIGGVLLVSVVLAWPGAVPDQHAVLNSISFGPAQGIPDSIDLTLTGGLAGRAVGLTQPPRCRIDQSGTYGAIRYSIALDSRVSGHDVELRIGAPDFPGPGSFTLGTPVGYDATLDDSTGVISYENGNFQQTAPLGQAHGTFWIGAAGHTGGIDAFLVGLSGSGEAKSVTVKGTWSCTYLSL